MKKKMQKCIALFLAVVLMCSLVACEKEEQDNTVYDNYSYGLTEKGLYENLEAYEENVPDFSKMTFTCDEILEWGTNYLNDSGDIDYESVDDYVYGYGEEFLEIIGVTGKEVVEEGDTVSASIEFYLDELLLEDYTSTNSYTASANGDEITKSFLGHNEGDEYETKYTFPEDATEHASKEATVKICINSISIANPIENGVVETNLSAISEYLDDVTDVESFLTALRPKLAESTLDMFMQNYLQTNTEIVVPDEFVEYEIYRLKARLQQIGYDYKEYLKTIEMTEEEAVEYCTMLARENMVCMFVYSALDYEITDEEIDEYYGSNREYVTEVQGEPYIRLNMIRDIALLEIVEQVTLIDGDMTVSSSENISSDEPDNAQG